MNDMTEMNFDGAVAIITGAGGGLGFEFAKQLAERDARILINDLGQDPLGQGNEHASCSAERAAARIRAFGGDAIWNTASVADELGVAGIVEQALDTWGQINLLVNNAGITGSDAFPDGGIHSIRSVMDVNFFAAVHLSKAVWSHMKSANYGRIVNVCSNSIYGVFSQIAYNSSKAALYTATRQMANAVGDSDIKVNAILPSAFSRLTEMLPDSPLRQKLERDCQPHTIAPLVAYLMHKDCVHNGRAFAIAGNRIALSTFAETASRDIGNTPESIRENIGTLMPDNPDAVRIMHSTTDSLLNLGLPPE
ncbi:MAG: SDR family NAD(P)-dependent oxidoreductase [Pseudomonadales bacterium]